MDKNQAEQILKTLVLDPNSQFRSGQWEAIDALVNRNASVLVVQRTGWGKSSVYFTATKILRDQGKGLTLIVSPLLALMRNQIDMANKGNLNVVTINSANTKEWGHCKQEILSDSVDALLVSPERLANEDFVTTTLRPIANHIGLIVIDEAHCISDWGHDFRPDYRRIMNLLVSLPPNVPVLGTTATANQRVIDDIQSQLGDIEIQRGPLMRESIALQNLRLPKPADRQAWLLKHIDELPGTGIIYALTKRDAETVATFLSDHGVDARAYFSDVKNPRYRNSDEYRKHLESLLFNNEIKALVATSALGMGYDKPDLGFVIHYQAPSSIISYYQQVGRAGRGIEHAVGVLMTGAEDTNIQEYFRTSSFPPEEFVSTILNVLSASDGMNIREIEAQINLSYTQINTVLKYLSVETPSPVLQDGARWRRTAVDYSLNHSKIRFLTQQRVQEWEEIQAYVDERGCLMEFLANSLDDKNPTACGKCAPCRGEPVVSSSFFTRGQRASR